MKRISFAFTALCSLPVLTRAQVQPGEYLFSVQNTTTTVHELWSVDTQTRKATQLTMSPSVQINCMTMLSNGLGYIGTVDDPPQIHRMTLAGTTATMTAMFKTSNALAGQTNIAQIARVGGNLYFSTNPGGSVYSIPIGGGTDPTLVYDLTTVTGFPTSGLVNALAGDGAGKVWAAVWTVGEIYEIDVSATTPTAKFLTTLPVSKLSTTTTGFYPVNMHYRANKLECFGLYGDVVVLDPVTLKVDNHWYAVSPTQTGFTTSKNCGIYNPDQGDYTLGSRDGCLDVVVPVGGGQIARADVQGIGAGTLGTNNSVNGVYYNPVGASYVAYDSGCNGQTTHAPTSTGRGAASKGNSKFAFGLDTCPMGQNIAILLIGANKLKIDLAGLGLGGCNLLNDALFVLPVLTDNATVDGFGSASIPVPLPNTNLTLHTQWLIYHVTNKRFEAISDGRTLTL
ncbi:MAG: hypothetical protein KDC95_02820 [Planctomycetes bacterium]|nr:hypothetical protein [Planctomycetota bacterium]